MKKLFTILLITSCISGAMEDKKKQEVNPLAKAKIEKKEDSDSNVQTNKKPSCFARAIAKCFTAK